MFSCYPMYECHAHIQQPDGTYAWVKGFECGTRKEDGLLCFIAENDSRTKHWIEAERLNYEDGA